MLSINPASIITVDHLANNLSIVFLAWGAPLLFPFRAMIQCSSTRLCASMGSYTLHYTHISICISSFVSFVLSEMSIRTNGRSMMTNALSKRATSPSSKLGKAIGRRSSLINSVNQLATRCHIHRLVVDSMSTS
jgi:hypothetical protein